MPVCGSNETGASPFSWERVGRSLQLRSFRLMRYSAHRWNLRGGDHLVQVLQFLAVDFLERGELLVDLTSEFLIKRDILRCWSGICHMQRVGKEAQLSVQLDRI